MAIINIDTEQLKKINSEITNLDITLLRNYIPSMYNIIQSMYANIETEEVRTILNRITSSLDTITDNLSTDLPILEDFLARQISSYVLNTAEAEEALNAILTKMEGISGDTRPTSTNANSNANVNLSSVDIGSWSPDEVRINSDGSWVDGNGDFHEAATANKTFAGDTDWGDLEEPNAAKVNLASNGETTPYTGAENVGGTTFDDMEIASGSNNASAQPHYDNWDTNHEYPYYTSTNSDTRPADVKEGVFPTTPPGESGETYTI